MQTGRWWLATGIVAMAMATHAPAALTIKVVNENPDYHDSNCFVMFYGGTLSASCSSGAVVSRQSYSLHYLGPNGIHVTSIVSGVGYLSLGKPMATLAPGTEPSCVNWTAPDYTTRWDRFEITYTANPNDVADLTGINAFAIPLRLETYKTNVFVGTLQYYEDTETLTSNLMATTTTNLALVRDESNRFVRVIGPTSYGADSYDGRNVAYPFPYVKFESYIEQVRTSGVSTVIAGYFSGSAAGTTTNYLAQNYHFIASFDANSNLVMAGGGGLVGTNHTVSIASSNIGYQIYAIGDYVVDGSSTHDRNDMFEWALADLMSGFACGFVGSTVIDPGTGVAFKNEASSNWYAATQTMAFGQVQSNKSNFNQYAEVFYRHSDTYGFPYSDRLHKSVQISVDPARVDTLVVTIPPDVVPEPMVALPLALLFVYCFSRGGGIRLRSPRE